MHFLPFTLGGCVIILFWIQLIIIQTGRIAIFDLLSASIFIILSLLTEIWYTFIREQPLVERTHGILNDHPDFCELFSQNRTDFISFQITVKDTDVESELICPITLDKIIRSATLKCGHVFEHNEIMIWLLKRASCPLCRLNVVADTDPQQPISYQGYS